MVQGGFAAASGSIDHKLPMEAPPFELPPSLAFARAATNSCRLFVFALGETFVASDLR